MNHCCVISCLIKRNDKRYKFYAFPSDLDVCTLWVDFCHCPEISERLTAGGPYGLRKFAICSEHFEPWALEAVDANGQLPANTVPVRIGKTHMTQKMLLEKGFDLGTQTDHDSNPRFERIVQPIDQVLVEMLNPEDMEEDPEEDSNFEFVGVKRMKVEQQQLAFDDEHELKQEPVEEIQPEEQAHTQSLAVVERRITRGNVQSSDLKSGAPVVQKQQPCVYCVNFKPRYKYEVKKNKRLEEVITQNKKKISVVTTKMQKLHDQITLKKMKRIELRKKYSELKQRCKKGIPLEITETVAVSDDDASFDEAAAWW